MIPTTEFGEVRHLINTLAQIAEGQLVECLEDLYISRYKGSNVLTKVFSQGETYPILMIPQLGVLAVVKLVNGYIQTYFILPEQSDLYATWDKFNERFKVIEG